MLFRELVLEARSPGRMRRFYVDTLGMAAAGEHAVAAGECLLVFRLAAGGTDPTYHFALRTPWGRFDEAKAWLAARTRLLTHEGRDELDWSFWGARACYFADPAGNVGELIAYDGIEGDELVLGLAEVGLPVADVREAVSALRDAFGIGLWDRAHVGEGITPVGVRGATFILVPVGRRWFLGGPAVAYPLEAALEGVSRGTLALPGQPYGIRATPPRPTARHD